MVSKSKIPDDPLTFIQACVSKGRIFWTYHVNMRFEQRAITRRMVMDSVENYDVIDEYPKDKYLPSYLVFTRYKGTVFHILFAVDVIGENVRVITAYRPDPYSWDEDLKRRK